MRVVNSVLTNLYTNNNMSGNPRKSSENAQEADPGLEGFTFEAKIDM
jgi:hypothetical protein